MADDDTTDTDTGADDDVTSTDADGAGDGGAQRALAAERKARRTAEKTLKDLQTKLQGLEDKDKSEAQRLQDAVTVAEKRAADAEARLLRIEVGAAKGLSVAQAKRLVGETQEELEADADELLTTFGAASSGKAESDAGADKAKPSAGRGRPKEDLRGGASSNADSGDKPVDPAKLAASILSRPF
ncbi:hypothetical protein [Parafrankia sp. EUN1f]|uniref:hypothetical protein n=1 Tax=Parafrankia sp. EUN1f TaxID=102897 RepID=UPI0001C4532A|nr:hypothetical protein [Parafrankia sp. EUN1f]EFC78948.1 hypothetical protein FrEUN1fDRAFT_7931 [Parafrankia sp. EUN1f]